MEVCTNMTMAWPPWTPAKTKNPTPRSLPRLTTPLPHLPSARASLKAFKGFGAFFKHVPPVSLPGPETNLSLLQTLTFLYFDLTVHQARRLCAATVPHSSIHREIRFQLLPLALNDDNPGTIRMPNSWKVLQPLSSGPPGGLSLTAETIQQRESTDRSPELFILLRCQQLWKNTSDHLGTDSGHSDHLL